MRALRLFLSGGPGCFCVGVRQSAAAAFRAARGTPAKAPAPRPFSAESSLRPHPPPPPPPPLRSTSVGSSPLDEEKVLSDILGRIRQCNHMPDEVRTELLDFVVDGKELGRVTRKAAQRLCASSPPSASGPIFRMNEREVSGGVSLTLTAAAGDTCESRTDAVMSVMEMLRSEGVVAGWRDELYPVAEGFHRDPVLLVERAAAPLLGALEYGVHVNGLVRGGDGSDGDDGVQMWMARRSATKGKYPGMLDQIVAGGQPAGLGPMENVIKECEEEAGIPALLSSRALPTGAISYETFVEKDEDASGIDGVVSRVVLFCYDLFLPPDFDPIAVDGEVDDFFLWGIEDVKRSMALDFHDPIKPNCYLVIIDYLLRAGHVAPETPGYLDVLRELRSGSCC